jgi:hypothetical protein
VQNEILSLLRGNRADIMNLATEVGRLKKAVLKKSPGLEAELKSEEGADEDMKDRYPVSARQSIAQRRSSSPGDQLSPDAVGYEMSPQNHTDEEETGGQIPLNEPTIPVGHTTGAVQLLKWPSIAALVGEKLSSDKIKLEYPYLKEMKHKIRVYGRGPDPTQAQSPEAIGDDYSDQSPSPAPDNSYGQLGSGTPASNAPPITRNDKDCAGGLRRDGTLDLEAATVDRLITSYLDHIHIMHPILDPQRIRRLSKQVIKNLPPDTTPKTKLPGPPGFMADSAARRQKQSPQSDVTDPITSTQLKPGRPQRSTSTALLLIVLALGKICEYTGKIPNVLPEKNELSTSDSPSVRNGHLSPIQASPTISSNSSGLPSPHEGDRHRPGARRASVDAPLSKLSNHARNWDVIPGLAYVAHATDIVGNDVGEPTLESVQVNILTGLYFGQLARPVRSQGYIALASSALQSLLNMYVF